MDKTLELSKLSNELITRKYIFNKIEAKRKLSTQDYIIMHIIADTNIDHSIFGGKTYFKDISEKMNLTIRQTSKLVNELKNKGLIKWMHEGDGSNGTFVEITDEGRKLFEEERIRLEEFYGHVIEKFGVDNMRQLLNLMKQLETIISGALEEDVDYAEDE